jgi:hypothetical protein
VSELQNTPNTIELAAEIVSAFVSNNSVPMIDLPALIGSVHAALTNVASGTTEPPQEELRPAVPIRKSVQPDYIVSLEDGKRFKSLKRHLRTVYNLTPDSIGPSGVWPTITRWSRRTTPQPDPNSPGKWAWVPGAERGRNQNPRNRLPLREDGARRPPDPIRVQ